MEGNTQFIKSKTVVDLQGKMVQEYCLVSLEQKPVLYFSDYLLLVLRLLILLSNRFVDVLLFSLIGVTGLNYTDLFVLVHVCHLDLLDYLFVLKVNGIHLGGHLQFVLCRFLGQ